MGCYPMKEMISRALGRCKGKERRRPHHRMVYSPPPSFTFKRSVAKSVNFSNHDSVILIPPEPDPGATVPEHHPERSPGSSNGPEAPESKEPRRTQLDPGPRKYDNGHPGQARQEPGPVRHGPVRNVPVPHNPDPGHHGPLRREPDPVYRGPVPHYAPSPLPRWEDGARHQEYFGGEYRSYPTPIREGIYSIATDPHRLATVFSEENPNACAIV